MNQDPTGPLTQIGYNPLFEKGIRPIEAYPIGAAGDLNPNEFRTMESASYGHFG